MKPKGNYIAGRWQEVSRPDGEILRCNPARLSDEIGRFAISLSAVDAAMDAAQAAFCGWSALSISDRWIHLVRLAASIDAKKEELAKAVSREIGKPLWEAKQELQAVATKFTVTRQEGMKLVEAFSATAAAGTQALCRFKPRGVLSVIAPFNFPLHLTLGHVIPALACGNTIVMKPSELAPLVTQMLFEAVHEANLPNGVFNMVQGDARVGQQLAGHRLSAGVLFTGSYEVGRKIEATARRDPAKIAVLEMGGKNASVIWNDADLTAACSTVLQSAIITSGQRCTCTSKIIVHREVIDDVCERLKDLASRVVIGDPFDPGVFMGPLSSDKAKAKFLHGQILAQEAGGENLLPGRNLTTLGDGHFVAPSMHRFKQPVFQSAYFDEEFFSPEIAIYPADSLDEAITIIEKSRYGLAAAIFTRNQWTFEEFFARVNSGVINWNRTTTGSPSNLPFGGVKASGNHFPTALFAPYYCTYPVASIVQPESKAPDALPGFPEAKP